MPHNFTSQLPNCETLGSFKLSAAALPLLCIIRRGLCAVSEEAITPDRETGQGGAGARSCRLDRAQNTRTLRTRIVNVQCLHLGKDWAFGPVIAVATLSEFGDGVTNCLHLRNLTIEFGRLSGIKPPRVFRFGASSPLKASLRFQASASHEIRFQSAG